MTILQLTVHFYPNVGGVETHLNDLVKALVKRGWEVCVLAYQPLTTRISWNIYESGNNLTILRIPWMHGLFYKLISYPLVEFFYLLPGLFLVTPWMLVWKKSDIIHAHGLIAGSVGVFWGRIFNKRVIISTHSIYHFPKKGLYRNFASWIFKNANKCLGLSEQAINEIKSLGIPSEKVTKFTYWVDLERFNKIPNAKHKLEWTGRFVVLFIGRLVKEKGILILLQSLKNWDKNIILVIAGSGPLEENIKYQISNIQNVEYLGKVGNDRLSLYYSAADVVIVPSIHEEGFGRVILESLACGTPVIGANRGAIPEAMDNSVGELIDVTLENIKSMVESFYSHPNQLHNLSKNCRNFAERRYSEKNVKTIIKAYTG